MSAPVGPIEPVAAQKPAKKPWSPLKAALIAFGLTLVIGLIVGVVLLTASGNLHDNPEARGERFGNGLAPLAILVAGLTYLVVHLRRKRGS